MFGSSEVISTFIGDFSCINTLWHQQGLGSAANSPLPVPPENPDWGTVVCRNQLLLDSGVKPSLLGLQSPGGTSIATCLVSCWMGAAARDVL